jgi:hypothetical protein
MHDASPREKWFGLSCVQPIADVELALVPLIGHTLGHAGVAVRVDRRWLFDAGDAYFLLPRNGHRTASMHARPSYRPRTPPLDEGARTFCASLQHLTGGPTRRAAHDGRDMTAAPAQRLVPKLETPPAYRNPIIDR